MTDERRYMIKSLYHNKLDSFRTHCCVPQAFYAKETGSATGGIVSTMQISGATARILAPAKINLFLEILEKRPDGFHEIITVMQAVSLFDVITVTRRPGGTDVVCDAENVPPGRENIAWRASEAMLHLLSADEGVRVEIDKTIPVGRGLGGGSSDAAAVILAINQLWDGVLDTERLEDIAGKLGSDVPFFLHGGTAICRGRGETVNPVDSALEAYFVILSPSIGISTRRIYEGGNFSQMPPKALTNTENQCDNITAGLKRGDFLAVTSMLYNRFEKTVLRLYPELSIPYDHFVSQFDAAVITGTGSAVFGLCRSRCQAEAVAGGIDGSLGDVYVVEALPGVGQGGR